MNGVSVTREVVRRQYKKSADHIKITSTEGVLTVAKSEKNPQFMQGELDAIVETATEAGMPTSLLMLTFLFIFKKPAGPQNNLFLEKTW